MLITQNGGSGASARNSSGAFKAAVYLGCVPLNVRNARVHHFILVWHAITMKMKWCSRALRTLSGMHL